MYDIEAVNSWQLILGQTSYQPTKRVHWQSWLRWRLGWHLTTRIGTHPEEIPSQYICILIEIIIIIT